MGSWCSIDLAYTKESRRSEKGVHKIQNNFFIFFASHSSPRAVKNF